ncbi:MAG: selenium-dependent xanthine dehydrogenase [Bacillota bacterium]
MHFFLNGMQKHCPEEQNNRNLLEYLRTVAGITSVKNGCGEGACGTCMVLIDGKAARSCRLTLAQVARKRIVTVEGLSAREQEVYQWAFTQAGAVQCGFCTPGMVISAKGLLDTNLAPSEAEIKHALRGNLCRCTGYVKIIDAVKLAAEVFRNEKTPVAEMTGYGVGARYPRLDAGAKTLGTAVFTDDLILPEMLYAAVLRSPHPRIIVKKIDPSRAKNLAGVLAVLTAQDIPGQRYQGYIKKDWPVLVAEGEETHYTGDALALVAAETPAIARQALDLIDLSYEVLPPVTSPAAAMDAGAPHLHPGGNVLSTTSLYRGNVADALQQCRYVVAGRYSTPMTEHAFLEPESAVAYLEKGSLVVLGGSQSVHHDQHQIASLLGLPLHQVKVVNNFVGGAFGGKEDLSVQHHAALLAWHVKRPVKLTLSRAESLMVHPKRHPMEIEITTGCDEAGNLMALSARIVADTGAYASLGAPVLERACTHATGPYRIPNISIEGQAVYTNNPPAGAFRGFGVPQTAFAIESQLDLLAEKVGISPWEIRYRNALIEGDLLATGQAVVDVHLQETLLAVKDDYEGSRYAGIACAMKNVGIGVGLIDTGRARIAVENGKVKVYTGAACIGQGLAGVVMQILCATAPVSPEMVEIVLADTGSTPDSGATTASRQTLFTGEAVRLAAEQLAKDLATHSLGDLAGKVYHGEFHGTTDPLHSEKPNPVTHVAYSFGTQVVILNKQGKVEKVIAAYDVGQAINPTLLEGQIEGGVIMGLGYALTEDYPLSGGVPQVKSLGRLGLWRAPDVPEIKIVLIEKNSDGKAYGAKGIGEISSIPTAPAVAAAYYALDGKRRFRLPLEGTAYPRKTAVSSRERE